MYLGRIIDTPGIACQTSLVDQLPATVDFFNKVIAPSRRGLAALV